MHPSNWFRYSDGPEYDMSNPHYYYPCVMCDKGIRTGELCDECAMDYFTEEERFDDLRYEWRGD